MTSETQPTPSSSSSATLPCVTIDPSDTKKRRMDPGLPALETAGVTPPTVSFAVYFTDSIASLRSCSIRQSSPVQSSDRQKCAFCRT
jgi:hypothetical protein